MTNDFATISAESELRDQITLTPAEQAEANQWFDERAEDPNEWLRFDEPTQNEGHMYPDDGDYDPSSDF